MDPALTEKLLDIPKTEIDRLLQAEAYSRWTYFTDAEAGQAGVVFANDDVLALYHPGPEGSLQPGPLGDMELRTLRYVPSGHQLYVERAGKFLTLQVFTDPRQADQDKATAQQWQQFLAEHSVDKMTVPADGQSTIGVPRRQLAAVAAALLAAIVAFAVWKELF